MSRVGRLRSTLTWRGRRIRPTVAGVLFIVATFAVGFAAINTGNNLLYLLLGGMLGALGMSGWHSERALRGVRVTRRLPRGVPAGEEATIAYTLANRGKGPVLGVELREMTLPGTAFIPRIGPGERVVAHSVNTFLRRGLHPLTGVTLATTYPFGFIRRERDIVLPDEVVVWPRTDRRVAPPRPGVSHRIHSGARPSHVAGPRGEFRGLREYREGDDARDIHWRRSAGRPTPVMREYDRDTSETLWIVVDLDGAPGEAAEEAIGIAAGLAAHATAAGRRHGVVTGARVVHPGIGRGHLEHTLDTLARAEFRPGSGLPPLPAHPSACVLVGTRPLPGAWADVRLAGERPA